MRADAVSWLSEQAGGMGRLGLVVDLGGGDGPAARDLFHTRTYLPVDVPGGDVVGGVRQHTRRRADAVVCSGWLHQAPNPAAVIAGCRRVIRRGGVLLVTAPISSSVRTDHLWEWLARWATSDVIEDKAAGNLYVRAIR